MKNFVIGLALGMVGGMMLSCCPCVRDFAVDAKDFIKKDVVDPMKRCVSKNKRRMEQAIKDIKNDVENVMEND